MRTTTHWIELSVLLIALTAIVWLGFDKPEPDDGNRAASASLAAQVEGIHQQLEVLHDKAGHYLDNAPREYEAYFRDTEITDHYLRFDLDVVTRDIEELTSIVDGQHPQNTFTHPNDELIDTLPLEELGENWSTFMTGLNDQLGVDPEMPRLEWGAQHILDEIRPVMAALESVQVALVDNAPQSIATTGGQPTAWAWPAFPVWILLMLVWFGARVRRSATD